MTGTQDKEAPALAGSRARALVYGDVDLNLLDGSAIWLQSVTQALVAAGCAVTLVLKAPVRTDRLVAPLRELPAVTIRSPQAEQLLPGLTEASLTVAQAVAVLAAVDGGGPDGDRHDLVVLRGRALVSASRAGRLLRRAAVVLPDRRAPGRPGGHAAGGRGPHQDRPGLPVPAVPDRGAALLPRRVGRRRLRQVGAVPAGAARPRHPARPRAEGRPPAQAGLHRQVRPAVEHAGDDRAAGPAGQPRRQRRGPHGRRQGARRPARPLLPQADAGRPGRGRAAGRARRDLARRAAAGRGDAAGGRGRHRAVMAAPRSSTPRSSCRPRCSSSASSACR